MRDVLTVALVVAAVMVAALGFERYRGQFNTRELGLSLLAAAIIVAIALIPGAIEFSPDAGAVAGTYLGISLLLNVALVAVLLHYLRQVRGIRDTISELNRSLSVDQAPIADGGGERIFIIIPAYNEAETIQTVVAGLPDRLFGHQVQPVVVSDASVDETAERARSAETIVVEHPVNQGQGGALKTGFQVAIDNQAAIVVTMDGDGQHPADELETLVEPIIEGEADFVMGSRYVGVDRSNNGPLRKAGIRVFTTIINVLTKSNVTDCTNGFRAIRGTELAELTLTEERFSAPELIIEARKNGLRIKEIPITIEARQAGSSKKPQLGYALGLTRTILVTWLR